MSYGIEENDRHYIDMMMEKQKDYLLSHEYNTMSANIVPHKYLAELNNRISALVKVVQDDNCVPIFITITAPSAYHPTSKRFNNESVHATTLYLSHIWKKMLNGNIFKRIKENGDYRHFLRTYEPHKSGVPHLHALVYIPKRYVRDFKKSFIRLMMGQQIKQYKFLFQFRKSGYKSNFEGSKAYILKYIMKSLKSARHGTMTDEGYWYIKNDVRRVSMSNSLVPLHIFRKIKYIDDYQNIYQVNIHYKNKRLLLSPKKSFIELHYFNQDDLIYDSKILWTKPYSEKRLKALLDHRPMKFKPKTQIRVLSNKIPVYNGFNQYIGYLDKQNQTFTKDFFKYPFHNQYNDLELYELVKTLDDYIDKGGEMNLTKYGVFKEEAKRRCLFSGTPISIDDYNDSFDFIDIFLE